MKYASSRQVIAQVTGKTELSDTLTVQECMDVVHAYVAQNFPHSVLIQGYTAEELEAN